MMRRPTTLALAMAVAVALAACAGDTDEPTTEPDPPMDDVDDPDEPTEPEEPVEDAEDAEDVSGSTALLGDEVQLAIDDAVERTGADRDDIEVVTTELVTWPDGSLGCPDPDMMYTQALVEGYRIVLEVDGSELAYHGADGSPPSYCADPSEPAAGGRTDS